MSTIKIYQFFKDMIRSIMTNPLQINSGYIFSLEKEKRALCIGIDYIGENKPQLNGCIDDQISMVSFLKKHCYFNDDDIVCLRDDMKPNMPYKSRIIHEIESLVAWANARPGSSICFFYAGHSSLSKNDKCNKLTNCVIPVDAQTSGVITNELLHNLLLDKLNSNVTLFIMVDACNVENMFYKYPYLDKSIYIISGNRHIYDSNECANYIKSQKTLMWFFENTFNCFRSLSTHCNEIEKKMKKMNIIYLHVLTLFASPKYIYLTDSIL